MTSKKLIDPQARCLGATGAEAEALEAEYQAALRLVAL